MIRREWLEIDTFVDQYRGVPLKHIDLGAMLSDLVAILREHGLVLPSDLALLIKAFIALEGMGRQLDPDFDMTHETAPFLEQVLLAHAAPSAMVQRGWRSMGSALALLTGLPQDLRQLLRSARRGKLHMQVDVPHLKTFGDRLDRAASRLAISIVTAALIVGSAIVMTVEREPAMAGLPSFGLLGFVVAVIGGLWVLWSIWRGGKG